MKIEMVDYRGEECELSLQEKDLTPKKCMVVSALKKNLRENP